MTHLNSAHCNDSQAGCFALPGEPAFLESGIYLAKGAERPAPARWQYDPRQYHLGLENGPALHWGRSGRQTG